MKKIFFSILAILIILGGWYFFSGKNKNIDLEKIKFAYPNLAVYVDGVMKAQDSLNQNKDEIDNYTALGLAWKSLADWSQKEGVENYKDYYREALKVYQTGIERTQRKNTLLMTNAANMERYLGEYKLAEEYYKEAISVSQGDESYYVYLAELYEYQMGKSKEEILAVYDEGLKWVINKNWLESEKESYLERNK
jgi:tetratricopeptide (TPR) repeat protein